MKNTTFLALGLASIFLQPAISLFLGIAFALIAGSVYKAETLKVSKYLLQASIVGLGFGMNLTSALKSSSEGIIFTIFSVILVMGIGVFLAKWMGIERKLGYLISSGTAICGGSAIAAVSPIVRATNNETSMSLAVVFTLNAIALFIFPPIGHLLELTQQQFGTWAAIAIHDTSSVVGAGKAFGEEALQVATTVKLTRALWIIPLSIVSTFIFKNKNDKSGKVSIPWFILLFVVAMVINTYLPLNQTVSNVINVCSHKMLNLTLYLIGSTLSVAAIKHAGVKPIIMGVILWVTISITSLIVIIA